MLSDICTYKGIQEHVWEPGKGKDVQSQKLPVSELKKNQPATCTAAACNIGWSHTDMSANCPHGIWQQVSLRVVVRIHCHVLFLGNDQSFLPWPPMQHSAEDKRAFRSYPLNVLAWEGNRKCPDEYCMSLADHWLFLSLDYYSPIIAS